MTPRQRAYKEAQNRGMSITENREDRGIRVHLEAPRGHNFGGLHEITYQWHSGSEWPEVIKDIESQIVSECDEQTCAGWEDGVCDWWESA